MKNFFTNLFKPIELAILWLLNHIAQIVGNYGVAIIITTIIVKLILFPLTMKQERAMRKMKELQPEIDRIKAKHKGDPQKLNEEMGKLYKETGTNPLGGCLPLLIQMPIFLALFKVFNGHSIPETATFLWFSLKSPDALFVISGFSINALPLITAVLTFVQQKMTSAGIPTGEDASAQTMQSMMYVMPIMMLFIFYKMPAGINLYFLANSLLSIVQQYFVLKERKRSN